MIDRKIVVKERDKLFIKYLVCAGVGFIMVFLMFVLQNGFNAEVGNGKNLMRIFHNAFFVSGILEVVFEGFVFLVGEGVFTGVSYALTRTFKFFFVLWNQNAETYAQYRKRKKRDVKKRGEPALLFVGFAFIFISFIFLIVWCNL